MINRFRFPDKPRECTGDFLASLNESLWVSQSKYDGWRVQIYKTTQGVLLPEDGTTKPGFAILSRVGRYLPAKASMTTDMIRQIVSLNLPDDSVIDAEFIGPRGNHPPCLFIFDCLAWEGTWLTNEGFGLRWQRCQDLANGRDIRLAETRQSDFADHFQGLKQQWLSGGMTMDLCEGIVLKRKEGKLDLSFKSSTKSTVQFKLKYRDIRDTRY